MSTTFKHGHLLCPVTAVYTTAEHIYMGEGPYLKILNRQTTRLVLRERIFKSQAVHGIACHFHSNGSADLLIWGGRFVRRLQRAATPSDDRPSLQQGRVLRCSDWILHASWRPVDGDASLADVGLVAIAVTAHNALLGLVHPDEIIPSPADAAARIPSLHLNEIPLSASTRCLLYTASVKWIGQNSVLIAAGTAFGEVIIWSYRSAFDHTSEPSRITVHYAFSAHDGSIFGIDTMQLLDDSGPDPSACILATCSDDRTIRIWDISHVLNGQNESAATNAISNGEVNSIPIPATWGAERLEIAEDSVARLVAKTWAHNSRIWGVKFAKLAEEGNVLLLSHGEDTTSQLWQLAFESSLQANALSGTFTCLKKITAHVGKNVWASATQSQDDRIISVTGGADGQVASATIPTAQHSGQQAGISGYDTKLAREDDPDPYKSYCFIGRNTLLMTTRKGCVFLAHFRARSYEHPSKHEFHLSPILLRHKPVLANYSVVSGLESLGLGFATGSNGEIFVYDNVSKMFETFAHATGKIADLFALSTASNAYLLASAIGRPEATLFVIGTQNGQLNRVPRETILLNLDQGFVITSALVVEGKDRKALFLGSRNGKITRLLLTETLDTVISTTIIGSHEDAVTSMMWKADSDADLHGHLLTTGRDSAYAVHRISRDAENVKSTCVHRTSASFGPNIEGCFVRKSDHHLILYGFRSMQFVVYDETAHTEIISIQCGGAHRVWTFQPTECQWGGTFLWTKASELDALHYDKPSFTTYKHSGHGREIKACAVRPQQPGEKTSIIATGAEDTDIRIFEAISSTEDESTTDLRCIMLAKKHNTGLQQLTWSSNGMRLFSCASSEEFLVWRCGKVPFVRFGMVCESRLPPISPLPDLRIMSFTVEDGKDEQGAPLFDISMVFSDSTFRLYRYTPEAAAAGTGIGAMAETWALLHVGSYTTCCLTQTLLLPPITSSSEEESGRLFATAATDGYITFWTASTQGIRRRAHFALHHNSIKQVTVLASFVAADAHAGSEWEDVLLASVGDDNALCITRLQLALDDAVNNQAQDQAQLIQDHTQKQVRDAHRTRMTQLRIPSAHAAAINTCILVDSVEDATGPSEASASASDSSFNSNTISIRNFNTNTNSSTKSTSILATSGNDQMVKIWSISFDKRQAGIDGVNIKLEHALPTAVADVSNLDVVQREDTPVEPKAEAEMRTLKERTKKEIVVCGVGVEFFEYTR